MNYESIKECTVLSEQEKIPFLEVVSRLNANGIDVYYADLLTLTKTYYSENNAFSIPFEVKAEKIVKEEFSSEKIIQAIRLSQSGKIKYQEFLRLAMEAGVISYFVFIKGRKAIYLGRKGEQHVENFPS